MSNQITTTQKLGSANIKASFEKVLGNKAGQFVASLISAVQSNAKLQQCDFNSLIASATTAASLDLPVNGSLGFAYLIPYGKQVQFQIGYKGLIQLCIRSGQFKSINAVPVYNTDDNETVLTRLTALFEKEKPTGEIIGYAGYFKLLNGFEKSNYMSLEELNLHGKKYSKSFESKDKYTGKYNGIWKTNFESMATKTVLKLLLGKYAPMNVELQTAIIEDQKVDSLYVDNQKEKPEVARLKELLNQKDLTLEELETCREPILETKDDELMNLFLEKEEQLKPKTSDGTLIEDNQNITDV